MTVQHQSLYNTGGIPEFIEPTSMADARERVAELRLAIMSINDQIAYQQAAGAVDPAWLRKAATSRRFKTFEAERLDAWIAQNANFDSRIVAVVRGDYTDTEWDQVVAEANRRVS